MSGNIILCGFMGCGKSTVGRELARRLGVRFLDLDSFIEQQAGMRVTEIFAAEGEQGFRRREREAARTLAAAGPAVIAAGGGTVLDPENVRVLSATGKIVLLDVPLDALRRRLKGDESRPLLVRPDRDSFMAELYARRMPLYRAAATLTVDGTGSPREVADKILSGLHQAS